MNGGVEPERKVYQYMNIRTKVGSSRIYCVAYADQMLLAFPVC